MKWIAAAVFLLITVSTADAIQPRFGIFRYLGYSWGDGYHDSGRRYHAPPVTHGYFPSAKPHHPPAVAPPARIGPYPGSAQTPPTSRTHGRGYRNFHYPLPGEPPSAKRIWKK